MKEIEEMIQEDIKQGLQMLDEAQEKKRETKEKIEKEHGSIYMRGEISGRGITYLNPEYAKVLDDYKYYLRLLSNYGRVGAEEHLVTDIQEHYKTLQAKVEKKIGKIIRIEHLGGADYRFEGENGICGVEVIIAGGYNIQRKHTRWIINSGKEY